MYVSYSDFIKYSQQRSKISDLNVQTYNLKHKYIIQSNSTFLGSAGGSGSTAVYCSSGHNSLFCNWDLGFGQRGEKGDHVRSR